MQGAFVLLGRAPGGVSIVLLLVMMVSLAAYVVWRFWEGFAGQVRVGWHDHGQRVLRSCADTSCTRAHVGVRHHLFRKEKLF
jgi:hypothetical protein